MDVGAPFSTVVRLVMVASGCGSLALAWRTRFLADRFFLGLLGAFLLLLPAIDAVLWWP